MLKATELPPNSKAGKITFNPVALEDFRSAVRRRNDAVSIEGRLFYLRYEYDNTNYGDSLVHYKPATGFCPCGAVKIDKLLTEDI